MSKPFRQSIRYNLHYPLRNAVDELRASFGTIGSDQHRVLIASDDLASTSEEQFAPLMANRPLLFEKLGIIFNQKLLDEVLSKGKRDITLSAILAKLSFRTPASEALTKMERLRELFPHPTRIIYFDGDDDACVQWGGLLEHVDLYLKKQVFLDINWYRREFRGKNNLTDYVSDKHDISFADNEIPYSGVVPESQIRKIALGYNIAMDSKIVNLFEKTRPALENKKTIDVICRAACKPGLWIYPFRGPISEILKPLQREYSVLLPDQRVGQEQYYQEMRNSRICISPFGYGELCWRDFEAVLMGCMLIKPDLSHIQTEPNIFIPGQTYVPVRWDFSDLLDICKYYIVNEEERSSIAKRAYTVLLDYYANFRFVGTFRAILDRAGVFRH
jgi:hypothetical protein